MNDIQMEQNELVERLKDMLPWTKFKPLISPM